MIEVPSSASLSGRQLAQPESNTPSVKFVPNLIQDSVMQSQTNMSHFLKTSTAGYNLLDHFMANIGAHTNKEFETYLG